jgi:hypothetical protein
MMRVVCTPAVWGEVGTRIARDLLAGGGALQQLEVDQRVDDVVVAPRDPARGRVYTQDEVVGLVVEHAEALAAQFRDDGDCEFGEFFVGDESPVACHDRVDTFHPAVEHDVVAFDVEFDGEGVACLVLLELVEVRAEPAVASAEPPELEPLGGRVDGERPLRAYQRVVAAVAVVSQLLDEVELFPGAVEACAVEIEFADVVGEVRVDDERDLLADA